jgi:cytochrome c-type biogenesis protein
MDLTLGVALFAGLISFLSPCVLPVVPAYLGQLGVVMANQAPAAFGQAATTTLAFGTATAGALPTPASTTMPSSSGSIEQRAPSRWGALPNAIAFVLGFGLVFTAIGLSLNAATSVLRDHLPLLRQIGGIVLIVLGLNMMGVLRLDRLWRTWRPLERGPSMGTRQRRGVGGGLTLGVVFALGWTPCIGPTLGAILTMAAVSAGPQVAALLVAYCIGLGLPFIILAVLAERTPAITRPLLRHGRTIELIGGGLVVVMGIAILFDLLATFSNAFVAFWPQV